MNYEIKVLLIEFLILETGGIILGWLGIVYNTFLLIGIPFIGIAMMIIETIKINNEIATYKRMMNSEYGGYDNNRYRGYRDLERAVRSISKSDLFAFEAMTQSVITGLIVIFFGMIVLRLVGSIFLLVGTKNVSKINTFISKNIYD